MSILELNGASFDFQSLEMRCDFTIRETCDEQVLFLCISQYSDGSSSQREFGIFEVTSVASNIARNTEIELEDELGYVFGTLITGSSKPRNNTGWGYDTTAYILYYFLKERVKNDLPISQDSFSFPQAQNVEERSLVLIEENFVDGYIQKYKSGSELWGGFSHRRVEGVQPQHKSKLRARANIFMPTSEHETKAFYTVSAENTFTRFLNKYHIIELLFNYLIVARLRVAKSDIQEFRDIMNSYNQGKEIELLREILCRYTNDVDAIVQKFYGFKSDKVLAEKVFQRSKGGDNPLKTDDSWNKFWEALTNLKLSRADLVSDKSLKFSDVSDDKKYLALMCKIAAYWIYRIRCSIAHSKISEFIFADSEEKFILEAAEPLIDEVIGQLLTNSELQVTLRNSKEIETFLYPSTS